MHALIDTNWFQHIKAETTLGIFHRGHVPMRFRQWKCLNDTIEISLKLVFNGSIFIIPSLPSQALNQVWLSSKSYMVFMVLITIWLYSFWGLFIEEVSKNLIGIQGKSIKNGQNDSFIVRYPVFFGSGLSQPPVMPNFIEYLIWH